MHYVDKYKVLRMLSKSQYICGLQCKKSRWLLKNKPEERTLPGQQEASLFELENQVGNLACQLFPGGIEIKSDVSDFNGMIQMTRQLIDQGQTIIYEVAFKEQGILLWQIFWSRMVILENMSPIAMKIKLSGSINTEWLRQQVSQCTRQAIPHASIKP